jgi:hypothetical protein
VPAATDVSNDNIAVIAIASRETVRDAHNVTEVGPTAFTFKGSFLIQTFGIDATGRSHLARKISSSTDGHAPASLRVEVECCWFAPPAHEKHGICDQTVIAFTLSS